ncbi:hypothetical protein O6H91_Y331900 [Diphasiastrum complanatum]|nr:hypothetical protein O6H91_Y331900 [Diphasiastrum complanatum]
MQAATMAIAEEEEGPGVAVDTIPPREHLLDSSAAAAPQHDERLAEMEQAACAAVEEEVENDESKGMKRGRQDPENKEEVVEGELGDVDGSSRIDGQEPVGKKAKTGVDNGDAEFEFVKEQDRNGKAGDENVMDAEAKAKVEKPEAESEESGDQHGGDALGPSTDKQESTDVAPVQLGPKLFHSGAQMFTYFYDLLHGWVFDVDLNKVGVISSKCALLHFGLLFVCEFIYLFIS